MKTIFNKIYVLTIPQNKKRIEFIKYQFNELGLNFEFIYGTDFGNIKYDATGNEIVYPNLYTYLNSNGKDFGCTINHYNAILQAYEFGYNNVLVIEDDICFIKDKKLIEHYLNNLPEDADFVTWDPRFWYDDDFNNFYEDLLNTNELYINENYKYNFMFGSMMYAIMNRETMKLYLDNQRSMLNISDHVQGLFMNVTVNKYICSRCLLTDQFNIEYNFNYTKQNKAWKNNYKDKENFTRDYFYIPENFQSFTRTI